MRESPAFRVCIRCHGAWRAAVAGLLAATLAVQAAWLAARAEDLPPLWLAALAVLALAWLAVAAGALRAAPVELHWDARRWHLRPADGPDGDAAPDREEATAGRLSVALDLDGWMLLRFEREGGPRRGRRTWLPVQRRGLEAHWHALRCAVHSARPACGPDPAGARPGAGVQAAE